MNAVRCPRTIGALWAGAAMGMVLACTPAASSGQDVADPRPGVTTHFSQGWPVHYVDNAAALGTGMIRDSLHWKAIEATPGQYTFTDRNSGHVARACAAGMKVLLGIDPRNPLYDGGTTAYSPAGEAAFGRYLAAIVARYRGCVVAIEIGNEINGRNNVTGPAATNRVAWYLGLLRTVSAQLGPERKSVAILGGSTNTIATGFLDRLFAAGMLDLVDGVAVHPYRPDPEGVDDDLVRLRAAMARHGTTRPIWATEFSREFAAPGDAADYYLKAIALMESAHVAHHFWYALLDQKWFPTMGLLTATGGTKPAALAYATAATRLAPLGPAVRVDHGDPTLYHFRFGQSADLVWGDPRPLAIAGASTVTRSDGSPAPIPTMVDEQPVVIYGAASIHFGPPDIVADSFHGFARQPLAWLARREGDGVELTLQPVEWNWNTYLGNPLVRAMAVMPTGLVLAPRTAAVVRYTAPAAGMVHASACLDPLGTAGDGMTATIRHNGKAVWPTSVGPLTGKRQGSAAILLNAGDTVELMVSPGKTAGGDRLHYRFLVARSPAHPADC